MVMLQIACIFSAIVLSMTVLLRAAVALTNHINQARGATDEIKTHGFVWSIFVTAIVLIPAVGWIALGGPATSESSTLVIVVVAIVALPISVAVTGGILAEMLSTTWHKGMGVALCFNALVLAILGFVGVTAHFFGG